MSTKEVIIELDIIYKLFFNFPSSMFKERKDWLLWTFFAFEYEKFMVRYVMRGLMYKTPLYNSFFNLDAF